MDQGQAYELNYGPVERLYNDPILWQPITCQCSDNSCRFEINDGDWWKELRCEHCLTCHYLNESSLFKVINDVTYHRLPQLVE